MEKEDFEYFLSQIYTPLKGIENITDIIYRQVNEEWGFLKEETRMEGEELLALNYAINLLAKQLLRKRKEYVDKVV